MKIMWRKTKKMWVMSEWKLKKNTIKMWKKPKNVGDVRVRSAWHPVGDTALGVVVGGI